jgi:hypothetical protein
MIADLWILQFRREEEWFLFGVSHPFDEAVLRLDEVRGRLSEFEWRVISQTTGGLFHDRGTLPRPERGDITPMRDFIEGGDD